LDDQENNKAARLCHAQKMSKWLNERVFRTMYDPDTHIVPMDDKTGELDEATFNGGYRKDTAAVLSELMPKFLTKPESKCSKWVHLFDSISEIMTTFWQHADFNNFKINALMAIIDKWSIEWVKLSGREDMTN
jgi:hypothetical protein